MNIFKAAILTFGYIIFTTLVGYLKYAFLSDNFVSQNDIFLLHTIDGLIIGFVLYIFFKTSKEEKPLKIKRDSLKLSIFALILGLGFIYIMTPLINLYAFFDKDLEVQLQYVELEQLYDLRWKILSSVLLFPIIEEFFFRGYIQQKLQARYSIYSVIISAVLFSIIHLKFYDMLFFGSMKSLIHVYVTFFGGLIAGGFYYISKSLIPSIIFHIAWNLIATIT